MRLTNPTEVSSWASQVFPAETSYLQIQIQASHHRALDAGAVLGVVNALRSASTRPSAGPSGIDDASARHVSGTYAMVLSDRAGGVDAKDARAYVGIITSVPHGTSSVRPKANGARIRSVPTGHGIERTPQNRRLTRDDRTVRRHVY
jgi:hypothetical protein